MISRVLKEAGVLGINKRNLDFVARYNKRKYYPLADDKYLLKAAAKEASLPVPELYGSISAVGQLKELEKFVGKFDEFVVKPCRGSGGEGVIVIAGKQEDGYLRANGETLSLSELRHHITQILFGLYSLAGQPDKALIESRVKFSPVFEDISYQGVPDIRIVVFQGFPVLAMMRLPTSASNGRANLHQGAIGVGVDILTGVTRGGVRGNAPCEVHPDTGAGLTEITIPEWDRLLSMAAGCFELTQLGYLGVDIVFDKELGPLVLEVNARPGLNIQLANMCGLLPRLKKVESEAPEDLPVSERVALIAEMFA